jgi:hypothetical protein
MTLPKSRIEKTPEVAEISKTRQLGINRRKRKNRGASHKMLLNQKHLSQK